MSSPASFAIMRIEKIKNVGSVASSAGHALRDRPTPNADAARTPGNVIHIGDGLADGAAVAEAVTARIEGATHRRPDSVLCLEVFMGVSPDWAAKATPDQWEQWRQGCLDWMRAEFGADNVVFCCEHRDETTPHLSAFVTPIRPDGRLSASHWTGGGSKPGERLSQMQDRHHAAVRTAGLRRGIRGSMAKHEDVQRFYGASVNPPIPKLPPVEPPRVRDVLTPARSEEWARAETDRTQRPVRAIARRAGNADIERSRAEGAEATARRVSRERDQLRRDSDRLRDLPLDRVLTAWHLERDAAGSSKAESQWRDANQAHRITVTGSKWFDHDARKGGGGAIDLVCHLDRCAPKAAISALASRFGGETAETAGVAFAMREGRRMAQAAAKEPPPPFHPPEPNAGSWSRVRRFLMQERRLSAGVVDEAHRRGDLYADARGNAVWLQRDLSGSVVGAEVRGTGATKFQGVAAGSRPDLGMYRFAVGTGGPMILTESGVDTLSLVDLRGPTRPGVYVSTAGNASAQADHPLVAAAVQASVPVHVATDNDKIGKSYLARYVERWGAAVTAALPNLKDWNDLLRAKVLDGWQSAWDRIQGRHPEPLAPTPEIEPGSTLSIR